MFAIYIAIIIYFASKIGLRKFMAPSSGRARVPGAGDFAVSTVPDKPSDFSVSVSENNVAIIKWTTPNTSQVVKTILYINTKDDFESAVSFQNIENPGNTASKKMHYGREPGQIYWYWLACVIDGQTQAEKVFVGSC
ncbi:MAG TPA: hypothetical protein DD666_09530 [Advenella kashmirensis]|uniref:Uncharacterized protein n=1 Tax=Advenella kashmirensis TaxID=310575 RepID=A0A356LFE8_9BURK|nr:hypothetical protein [Advenella kashmirensis]